MTVSVREATSTNDPTGTDAITKVTAAVTTDTGVQTYTLSLTSGTNLDGQWYGNWVVNSTHSKKYSTTFTAINSIGETSSVTIDWEDPCTPGTGGSWTVDGNCSFSGINGVDNGNIYLNSAYTVTVNANSTFAWNPGKSFTITAGAFVYAQTASISQNYLWMQDQDADGYPTTTTQYASYTSPGAGYVRRYTEVTDTNIDCAPTNPGPCPPTGLSVTAASSSQVNLSWTAPTTTNGPAATGYDIYYCSGASCSPTTSLSSNQAGTTYSHTSLAASTTYGYYVDARNAAGVSASSGNSYATTPASCTNLTVYTDADHDGYYTGSGGIQCTTNSTTFNGRTYYSINNGADNYPYIVSGYLGGNDCCDTDANAYPGQTGWFTSADACGSFDYNCDGTIEQWGQYADAGTDYTVGAFKYNGGSCTSTSGYVTGPVSSPAPACGAGLAIPSGNYNTLYYWYSDARCTAPLGINYANGVPLTQSCH